MTQEKTGGCQCGRVRYRVTLENDDAYLCHCRMCQRATGGFAAAFVGAQKDSVTWESPPDWYRSSPIAHRPFCSVCGTPLGFAFMEGGTHFDLTVGSFDDPSQFVPTSHSGVESMHEAWLDTAALPRQRSENTESVAKQWRAAGLEIPE